MAYTRSGKTLFFPKKPPSKDQSNSLFNTLKQVSVFPAGKKANHQFRVFQQSLASRETFQLWLDTDLTTHFAFRYKNSDGEHIAAMFSSKVLPTSILLLSLDAKSAFREIQLFQKFLIVILLLTVLITFVLGKVLAGKIVQPVNALTSRVVAFSNGEPMDPDLESPYVNEIGQMHASFNNLVLNSGSSGSGSSPDRYFSSSVPCSITISTRRLRARLASSSLGTMGLVSAKPFTVNLAGSIPPSFISS